MRVQPAVGMDAKEKSMLDGDLGQVGPVDRFMILKQFGQSTKDISFVAI